MEIISEINILFTRAFSLLRYSMVLTIPFLLFWLISGFVLIPLNSGGGMFFSLILLLGITAAFLSGWMNMFKVCVETSVDENLPGDKRTSDSFHLFKEFFPGVGKYFGKIALGVVIFIFLFDILTLLLEITIVPFFGSFESFSQQEMIEAMKTPEAATQFWQNMSEPDKAKILKIAGLEVVFALLFFYLTMFWSQLVVLKDIFPLKALMESFKTVIKDPLRTSIIFFLNFILILIVFFTGAILIENPLFKLIMILLFVYALVFYVIATFLYLEKYGTAASAANKDL